LGGGTSIEEIQEVERDLDLDFLDFFELLALACFLDFLLEDFFKALAAKGTEPRVPPKGLRGPSIPIEAEVPSEIEAGTRGIKGL
jgi:hypothetical protein